MTQATKKTTQDIADLWLGMARSLVQDASLLHEQIGRIANQLKSDKTPPTPARQNELKRAIYKTSQIAKLLREEVKAVNALDHSLL